MPVVNNTTANRSYKLPHGANSLKDDVLRLIDAIGDVDQDIADIIAAVVLKAPLLSPAFTGAPTAPTPADADNSTKIATTAWVRGYLDDLAGAAPETLDTIAEIAEALQNNPDIISEMLTAIGGKLAKDQNLSDLPDKAAARDNLDVYARGAVHDAVAKATPANNDEFGFFDSVAAWALKKMTWANVKAVLKTYFDGLYAAASHNHDTSLRIQQVGALTKQAAFDLSVITAGQTRTLTVPDRNVDLGLTLKYFYRSALQTITNNTTITLTHGGPGAPDAWELSIVCQTADLGYAVGEELSVFFFNNSAALDGLSSQLSVDATNLYIIKGNSGSTQQTLGKTTRQQAGITHNSWRFRARAWWYQ